MLVAKKLENTIKIVATACINGILLTLLGVHTPGKLLLSFSLMSRFFYKKINFNGYFNSFKERNNYGYWYGYHLGITFGIASIYGTIIYLTLGSQIAMRESPKDANAHNKGLTADSLKSKTFFSVSDLELLRTKGFVVIDDILSKEEVIEARDEIDILVDSKTHFEPNGHDDVATRTDSVFWISEIVGHIIKMKQI
jgi:hypothetical protein